MFLVKVVGTYVARSSIMEKEKVKKNYEVEGNIPSINAALSVVKNKLLGPALTKKYPDYITFLTYHIIEITPLDDKARDQMNKAEIHFMDRPTLLRYIKDNNTGACVLETRDACGAVVDEKDMPQVNPTYYPSLFKLREAVQYAKDDPKGYQRHFQIHEPDLRLDLEMAKCNPDLFKAEEGFVASVSLTPATPKAKAPALHTKATGDRLAGLAADQVRDGEMGPLDNPIAPDVGDL